MSETNVSDLEISSPVAPSNPPSTSLYVGELDPSVTEEMLLNIFQAIGPVTSVRVCRDGISRRSLEYGYVNYSSPDDCERALDQLNYSVIAGKSCRIMLAEPDQTRREVAKANLFIGKLNAETDHRKLRAAFAEYGHILSCKVATDKSGASKHYGFVQYDSAKSAEKAIEKLNGTELDGSEIYVGYHMSRQTRAEQDAERKKLYTNLYVKNLDPEVTQDGLKEMFAEFGKITSAVVQLDAQGKSRGFGFVNLENHEDAVKAVEALHGKEHKGNVLYVDRAQSRAERKETLWKLHWGAKPSPKIFVKNLDTDFNESKLREAFEAFGTISKANVTRNRKDHSKVYGSVYYSSTEEAARAIEETNNKMFGSKQVNVSFFRTRSPKPKVRKDKGTNPKPPRKSPSTSTRKLKQKGVVVKSDTSTEGEEDTA